jgi:hypothetical protein
MQKVLAQNIWKFRHEAVMTQQNLADEVLLFDLPWRRETVAQTEASARSVKLNEILVLSVIFKKPLKDFFVIDDEDIEISDDLMISYEAMENLLMNGEIMSEDDWEPSEEQLISLTPIARYQKHTEDLVKKFEREKQVR